MFFHKQPTKGVLIKKCSENMQEIYGKTPMPKCDFNKIIIIIIIIVVVVVIIYYYYYYYYYCYYYYY